MLLLAEPGGQRDPQASHPASFRLVFPGVKCMQSVNDFSEALIGAVGILHPAWGSTAPEMGRG